jgi:hypothetical protein
MWKEETPVSRLIDELVGKKSLNRIFIIMIDDRGRLCPLFIF